MEMSGERSINAPRAEVWEALNNPDVLKACIPGCQEIEKTSDTTFVAKVVQKVGPVKATFTGEVELSDIVVGESYKISGKGKGGAAGGASGGANVTLADAEDGTLLTYTAEAKVTGKIAQLGGRLIDGFAKKMADQFFDSFQQEVGGPVDEADAEDPSIGDHLDAAIGSAKDAVVEIADKAEEVARGAASTVAETAGNLKDTIENAEPDKKGFWKRLFD
ncbi:MAG: carbon monoxide dehydrogenase subunit G [Pseudomonadota bacterium]